MKRPNRVLFWLGIALVAAAGVLAALLGPWWVALADGLIVAGLVIAQRRAERELRQAERTLNQWTGNGGAPFV